MACRQDFKETFHVNEVARTFIYRTEIELDYMQL